MIHPPHATSLGKFFESISKPGPHPKMIDAKKNDNKDKKDDSKKSEDQKKKDEPKKKDEADSKSHKDDDWGTKKD